MSFVENLTESPVERLAVEEVPPPQPRRPRTDAPSFRILSDEPAAPKPAEPEPVAAQTTRMLEAYRLLGAALSARLLLLLSILGSFALAIESMRDQTTGSLLILLAFTVGTVGPTTFLEVRRRG